ncbi:MAG: hypothetical protein H7315_15115 [Herminiimonas sp.]|nr:hypothetical protein [Herminiimonas sp.]
MSIFVVVPVLAGTFILLYWYQHWHAEQQRRYITTYFFPKGLLDKLGEHYPHLTDSQRNQVGRGLKQFFFAQEKNGRMVSMPSVAADALWHEFILYTKAYDVFCGHAFGRFLHHTPAVVLESRHRSSDGLRRMWVSACKQEGIDVRSPARLPLILALDANLAIAGGFVYQPDCRMVDQSASGSAIHCGAELGTPLADSGSGGDGSGNSDSVGGDSGGDGGGGDGGGCGGD